MRRRPPRSTRVRSSAASDVYKRQVSPCGAWSLVLWARGPCLEIYQVSVLARLICIIVKINIVTGGSHEDITTRYRDCRYRPCCPAQCRTSDVRANQNRSRPVGDGSGVVSWRPGKEDAGNLCR